MCKLLNPTIAVLSLSVCREEDRGVGDAFVTKICGVGIRLIPKLWRQQQGGGDSLQNLARNLGTLGSSLSAWDQSTFGSVHKKLSQLRKELEWVQAGRR
jgi:hypothetical protein